MNQQDENQKLEQILELLRGLFSNLQLPDLADKIKGARNLPLQEVIEVLYIIETETVNSDAYRAVTLAKQVLTDKKPDEELYRWVAEVQGLSV